MLSYASRFLKVVEEVKSLCGGPQLIGRETERHELISQIDEVSLVGKNHLSSELPTANTSRIAKLIPFRSKHYLHTRAGQLADVQIIFGWLDAYFHTCPDYLKPCIFYLSIFPRRQGIRPRAAGETMLDLEGTVEGLADDDIGNIVTRLPRLKFLSLRGCKDISDLPDSLGPLKQLETLDVRHTAIASLPATVDKLKELQYVRAGSGTTPSQSSSCCSSRACTWVPACLSGSPGNGVIGVDVHRGLGKLTNLHTLGVINATVAGLKELLNLTQLRKPGVSAINPKN